MNNRIDKKPKDTSKEELKEESKEEPKDTSKEKSEEEPKDISKEKSELKSKKRSNKTKGSIDLTEGSPMKKILLFSLPLVLGTLFQQLYSYVDTIMVGRLVGTDALAAVGNTYSLNFLILGFVQGHVLDFLCQWQKRLEPSRRMNLNKVFGMNVGSVSLHF